MRRRTSRTQPEFSYNLFRFNFVYTKRLLPQSFGLRCFPPAFVETHTSYYKVVLLISPLEISLCATSFPKSPWRRDDHPLAENRRAHRVGACEGKSGRFLLPRQRPSRNRLEDWRALCSGKPQVDRTTISEPPSALIPSRPSSRLSNHRRRPDDY
jgi:hypothetical protein